MKNFQNYKEIERNYALVAVYYDSFGILAETEDFEEIDDKNISN